jgi:hypothetical protein
MYYRAAGWLDDKNKDDINQVIINKIMKEEEKTGPLVNPFLIADINDIKLKMIKKLTDKLNLEMIFSFINEGDLTTFDKSVIPHFSDSDLKAANLLLLIAQQCTIEIINNEIKNEYGKYLLLKEFIEPDITIVIMNLYINSFLYQV